MKRRINFFLGHLLISLIIALLAMGFVFLIWYPAPLAKALGVTHISLMLLAIDVIVGPVLGFIVFKEGKKTLKMDLAIIIVLQLSALSYGLFSIYQGRPVWLVFQNDHFDLVRLNDVVVDKKAHKMNWLKPQFRAVEMGQTALQKNKYVVEEMQTGIPASYRVERYIPIERSANEMLAKKRDLKDLNHFNKAHDVLKIVKQYPQAAGWLPLRVMTGIDMVILIDSKGAVVKTVDLRPWKLS